jgi:hypothetical protein
MNFGQKLERAPLVFLLARGVARVVMWACPCAPPAQVVNNARGSSDAFRVFALPHVGERLRYVSSF